MIFSQAKAASNRYTGRDGFWIGNERTGLMVKEASIRLHPEEVIGEAHDHLYGANLEHIGQTIYGGVWAEMLRGRKFAGCDYMYTASSEGLHNVHPSIGIVAPWQAERDYGLRIVLKGEGQAVDMQLGDERWRAPAAGADWRTYVHIFTRTGEHPGYCTAANYLLG